MNWYKSRGLQIHYMTNNIYSDYLRPLVVFPLMLEKSGLYFICPQHLAWKKMENGGITLEQFQLYYHDYEKWAFVEAYNLIERCCRMESHYIHLDIDGGRQSFSQDLSYHGERGHILVFRDEVPQSSKFILL